MRKPSKSKRALAKRALARMEARDKLRGDLVAWLAWAHSVLVALQIDAEEMRQALSPTRPRPAALAEFLTHAEAAGIEGALEEAASRVSSVVVPALDFRKPDALAWNDAANAVID